MLDRALLLVGLAGSEDVVVETVEIALLVAGPPVAVVGVAGEVLLEGEGE